MTKYWVYKILINLTFTGLLVYSLIQRNTLSLIILVTSAVICSVLIILNDRINRKGKRKEKERD